MSYLPELRASLVRAAAREAAPPRRRRTLGPGWLAPAVAAGVALAVVALAVVLIGHRPGGGGAPAAHPGGAAAPPQMPNISDPEWSLIAKARRDTVAHDSSCSPFAGAPALSPGQPGRALTATLGVLRRPANSADTVPLDIFEHFPFAVYRSAIRFAREQDGVALYIVPVASVFKFKPVPRRCAAEEAASLAHEMRGASAKRQAAALDGQRRYLAWQQYEAEHPQGVCLAEVDHRRAGARDLASGGIGCGWGVAEIEQGLAGLGGVGQPGPSLFHGIVPDGVASVVLILPHHLGTVTANVVNNLYLAPIPRSVQSPARIIWRAADGSVIRATRVP